MRKNHSKIVCIKLVHLPYLESFLPVSCQSLHKSVTNFGLAPCMCLKLPTVPKLHVSTRKLEYTRLKPTTPIYEAIALNYSTPYSVHYMSQDVCFKIINVNIKYVP